MNLRLAAIFLAGAVVAACFLLVAVRGKAGATRTSSQALGPRQPVRNGPVGTLLELQAVDEGLSYEQHGSTGCSNWKDIKIHQSIQPNWHACRQRCNDDPACAAFNFNPTGCGGAHVQQCYLYTLGCTTQVDECWDYYTRGENVDAAKDGALVDHFRVLVAEPPPVPAHVDEWIETLGTGCSNWVGIQITKTVEESAQECGNRCKATGGCAMYGFQPTLCDGADTAKACMLFSDSCAEQADSCWVLYKQNPSYASVATPMPARLAMVITDAGPVPPSVPNTGCSNWDKIKISRSDTPSADACHAKCKSTDGCKHFGYSHSQECMLFRADCKQQADEDWDFYEDSGAGLRGLLGAISGIGCSNWASIKIFNSLELTASKCHQKCKAHSDCVSFGFMPFRCEGRAAKECMLFGGACKREPNDCWDFYPGAGQAPATDQATEDQPSKSVALPAVVADRFTTLAVAADPLPALDNHFLGTGCVNWADIMISSTEGLSKKECLSSCQSTAGCLHFNYKLAQCGGLPAEKECMLFNGGCQQQDDECWDLFTDIWQRSEAVNAGHHALQQDTGCSNWADIELGRERGLTVEACRAKCQSTSGCFSFNYKAAACDDDPNEQVCLMYKGSCNQKVDECWDFYPDANGAGAPASGDEKLLVGTGCSNWATIEIGRQAGLTVDACRSMCQSTSGCLHFNYKASACDDQPDEQVCLLFGDNCDHQIDTCWDLYVLSARGLIALPPVAFPIAASDAGSEGPQMSTGCSNWFDIEMQRHLGISLDVCHARCQSILGCIQFSYKANNCGGTSLCLLFNNSCTTKRDACWDLYSMPMSLEPTPLPAPVPRQQPTPVPTPMTTPELTLVLVPAPKARPAKTPMPSSTPALVTTTATRAVTLTPAPPRGWRLRSGLGCSNWLDILARNIENTDEDSCKRACEKSSDCKSFGLASVDGNCILFAGHCKIRDDDRWTFYDQKPEAPSPLAKEKSSPAPPREAEAPALSWRERSGLGCGNWNVITIQSLANVDEGGCKSACETSEICVSCSFASASGRCLLLGGHCMTQADKSWTLHERRPEETTRAAESKTSPAPPREEQEEAPTLAPLPRWRERSHLGCSNWRAILLENIDNSDKDSCERACERSDGCVSFGLASYKACMIFGGHCETQIDDQWTLYDQQPELPAVAVKNSVWTQSLDTGCQNWEPLLIATTSEPTADECRLRCAEEVGCMIFSYKQSSCESEGEDGRSKECRLLAGSCQKHNDSCWVLEERNLPTPPRKAEAPEAPEAILWTHHGATGCSNWASISMGETLVVSDWKDCRRRCFNKVGCTSFNYKPHKCSSDVKDSEAQECVLFSGVCKPHKDECWEFYERSEGDAWAFDIKDVDEIALQAPSSERLVSLAAPLQCTELPVGNGTASQRCRQGNGLGDGYAYVYNRNRGTAQASCGPDAQCECCRRDLTKVPPAISWHRQGMGFGCLNWESIQAYETINSGTADRCGEFCRAHQGCTGFNFQREKAYVCKMVRGIRGGIEKGACVLFFGQCLEEPNPCFDTYQMLAAKKASVSGSSLLPERALADPWSQRKRIGCKNWNDIQIKRTVTAANSNQCAALCKLQPGCVSFNFQVHDNCTVGQVYRGACILFHSQCEFEENNCFDYFSLASTHETNSLDSFNKSQAHNASYPRDTIISSSTTGHDGAVDSKGSVKVPGTSKITKSSSSASHAARVTRTAMNVSKSVAPAWIAGSEDPGTAVVARHAVGEEVAAEVFGSMELEVQQPVDFMADAVIRVGIGLVVADVVGVAENRVSVALMQLPARRLMANVAEANVLSGSNNASSKGQILVQYTINITGFHGSGMIVMALSSFEAKQATQILDTVLERTGHQELIQAYSAKFVKVAFLGGTADKDAGSEQRACSDLPLAWTDKNHAYACVDYVIRSWCTASGGYGSSWDPKWGSFSEWGSNGASAVDACCGCGGGENASSGEETMGLDAVVKDGMMGAGGGMVVAVILAALCGCFKQAPGLDGDAEREAPRDPEA